MLPLGHKDESFFCLALCHQGKEARGDEYSLPSGTPTLGFPGDSVLKNLVLVAFPGALDGKESACKVGDLDSVFGLGRSPGVGNPLQYSCLGNPMDRGAWQATFHGVAKSQTWLSNNNHRFGLPSWQSNTHATYATILNIKLHLWSTNILCIACQTLGRMERYDPHCVSSSSLETNTTSNVH